MAERGLPESAAPGPLEPERWGRDKERLEAQLELLKSDPSALNKLRNDAQGCAVLISLARHSDRQGDRNLATTYLAIAFPGEPGVRAFFFDQLRHVARLEDYAALYAILANYADDDSAIRELVAIFRELTPGDIAAHLRQSVKFLPFIGVIYTGREPPSGVSKEAWEDWNIAIRSATLHLLPHPDLQALLFDVMRRDPDGPVEWMLEDILINLIRRPEFTPTDPVYVTAERTAHDLSRRIAALHPKWPRIDDYIEELDGVAKRRLPGWRRAYIMFDTDLENRQSRVAFRMSQFPDAVAVRRAFETMLFGRPPLYPKVRDEQDYFQFEPIGWRGVAWTALTRSHWSVDEGVDFARRVVGSGPWDNEARKSKEAIEAIVRTWPNEESVVAFLAESEGRADVGGFVRDDIARLRSEAQAGKGIRLDRYWGKG
jgi:hypothetical protein